MNLDDILQTRSVNDTGFDNSTGNSSGRVLNKDGTSNVIKSGLTYFKRISMFHTLIELPTFQFIMLVNFIFILLNIGFALIYFILGPNALHMPPISSEADRFYIVFSLVPKPLRQ